MQPPTTQPLTRDVIEELNPQLIRYASRCLRAQDVEDAVQEMWISALRAQHSFRGGSTLRTWLITILRRRIADQYDRARSQQALASRWTLVEARDGIDFVDLERALEHARAATSELTRLERAALDLVDGAETERDEASGRLGVSRQHLRVLLHRGRVKINRELDRRGLGRDLLSA